MTEQERLHQVIKPIARLVRVHKIVSSDEPDNPAYVRDMDTANHVLQTMLEQTAVWSFEQKEVSITISHQYMPQAEFEALPDWEPD